MISDDINNLDMYAQIIPEDVMEFIKKLNTNLQPGRYDISENSYANIDEYYTKSYKDCKLEAHKKYIDIQILLDGTERLDYIAADGLSVSEEYDEKRDVMFFHKPLKALDTVILKPNKFILLYPHEAHMPQMNDASEAKKVKKVVVKIKE